MAYRRILPTSQRDPEGGHPPVPDWHQPPPSTTQLTKRQRHTDAEWEALRPLITQLYYNNTLEETIKAVKDMTGFESRSRRFRSKLEEWGLSKKNINSQDIQIMLAKQEKRKRDEGKDTAVIINGTRVEGSKLDNIYKRQVRMALHHASPSAPTPNGVEYFTPMNNFNDVRSPDYRDIMTVENTGRAQSRLGVTRNEDRTVLRLVREDFGRRRATNTLQIHPFHQTGASGAIGSGRFGKEDRLLRCLWATATMAKAVPSMHVMDGHYPAIPLRVATNSSPQYSIKISPPEGHLEWNEGSILKLLRCETFIQNLLGFSREDCARWWSSWEAADEFVSSQIEERVTSTFGDPFLAYPGTNVMRIAVQFRTSGKSTGDVLLQMTVCQDPREYVTECELCDVQVVAIDLASPEGIISTRFTSAGPDTSAPWSTIDDFKSAVRVECRQSLCSHLELARDIHGWDIAPIRRRCSCGRKYHYTDRSNHMLDPVIADADNDTWDGEACAHQDQIFNPFPLDAKYQIVEEGESVSDASSSDSEAWDPDGTKILEETFDPSPVEHEEHPIDSIIIRKGQRSTSEITKEVWEILEARKSHRKSRQDRRSSRHKSRSAKGKR